MEKFNEPELVLEAGRSSDSRLEWLPEAGTLHSENSLKCTVCAFSMPYAQFVHVPLKEA